MERIHIHPQQTKKEEKKTIKTRYRQDKYLSLQPQKKKESSSSNFLQKKRKVCLTWKRMFNDNHTTDILNTQYSVYSKSNGLNKAIYVCIYICIYQIDMKESICTVH
jgi:hypothetical protein